MSIIIDFNDKDFDHEDFFVNDGLQQKRSAEELLIKCNKDYPLPKELFSFIETCATRNLKTITFDGKIINQECLKELKAVCGGNQNNKLESIGFERCSIAAEGTTALQEVLQDCKHGFFILIDGKKMSSVAAISVDEFFGEAKNDDAGVLKNKAATMSVDEFFSAAKNDDAGFLKNKAATMSVDEFFSAAEADDKANKKGILKGATTTVKSLKKVTFHPDVKGGIDR